GLALPAAFAEVLADLLKDPADTPTPGPARPDSSPSDTELRLRHLFQILDEEEVWRLKRDTRLTFMKATGSGLTATALDLTPHWARLRRIRAAADRQLDIAPEEAQINLEPWLRLRLRISRRFGDHYNAACTYAILLRPAVPGAPGLAPDADQL